MITSNQDALLKIDIEDTHIVCFNISAYCRNNISYFNWLKKILDYFNALEIVMSYLFNHDLLN